jgi:hypothetical protein
MMVMSRRGWLALTIGGLSVSIRPLASTRAAQSPAADLEQRVARIIGEYAEQGDHRTATAVDRASADWLSGQVRQAGLVPIQESFSIDRINPISGSLISSGRRIEGLPLFDGAFTDAAGIRGRLGPLGSEADIGFAEAPPNTAGFGVVGTARRENRHRAIVLVTRGGRPGLCPNNADAFLQPFGPPVLQVSSAERDWLSAEAQAGANVNLVAQVSRTPAEAANVISSVAGQDSTLRPLVIMTPRSGWYRNASERGGGIACWLEVMRALGTSKPRRRILFVASSGHELGHLGINDFVLRRPGLVPQTNGWMHFGANIGAAIGPGNRLQASDDAFDEMLSREMTSFGLKVDQRVPRGTVPGGEAEVVHRGGGRYVSIIGTNALFHNPEDRGPEAIAPAVIARFCGAFSALAARLAAEDAPLKD